MTEPNLYGNDLFGEPIERRASGPIADKFLTPPFSLLDSRSGDWQERKRAWLSLGIRGELGRSAKSYNCHDWINDKGGGQRGDGDGTSIFDPMLCECVYRWFCPRGGQVVDPFAGGSVRGIVAAMTGRRYWGCDLRAEQVDANRDQAAEICPTSRSQTNLSWVVGDAATALADAPQADLIFTCPPYGDLERYSDHPRDLSTMDWPRFVRSYRSIIGAAVDRLRPDRFAAIVVGDFRDDAGNYRDFVSTTVRAFLDAGLHLYNEAILATPVGSAAMRVSKQFVTSRKLVKVHQNLLVFVRGNARAAADAINEAYGSC